MNRYILLLSLLLVPGNAYALDSVYSVEEKTEEVFNCNDVDQINSNLSELKEEIDAQEQLNLLLAPACSKKKGTVTILDHTITYYYCDGACTNPNLTCQPTLNPDGSIKRCSCKP